MMAVRAWMGRGRVKFLAANAKTAMCYEGKVGVVRLHTHTHTPTHESTQTGKCTALKEHYKRVRPVVATNLKRLPRASVRVAQQTTESR